MGKGDVSDSLYVGWSVCELVAIVGIIDGLYVSHLVDKGDVTVSCAVCDIVDNVDIMDGLYLGFAVCGIVEDVDEVIDNIVCVGITASDLVDKGKVSDGINLMS